MLTAQERAEVIRETFWAIASVGCAKWAAEELIYHGIRVSEQNRQDYLRFFEDSFFAAFQQMTANSPDERLLDLRQDWVEMANAVALKEWQRDEAEKQRDDDPGR